MRRIHHLYRHGGVHGRLPAVQRTEGKALRFAQQRNHDSSALGGAQGQASDIKIAAEHILKTKRKLNEILARNSGRPVEQVEKDTDRDNYLSAEEALQYGLIDKVFYKR